MRIVFSVISVVLILNHGNIKQRNVRRIYFMVEQAFKVAPGSDFALKYIVALSEKKKFIKLADAFSRIIISIRKSTDCSADSE